MPNIHKCSKVSQEVTVDSEEHKTDFTVKDLNAPKPILRLISKRIALMSGIYSDTQLFGVNRDIVLIWGTSSRIAIFK